MSLVAFGAHGLMGLSLGVFFCLAGTACGHATGDEQPAELAGAGAPSAPTGHENAGTANGAGAPSLAEAPTIDSGGTAPIDGSPGAPAEPHAARPCENPQPYPLGGGYLVCEDKSLRRAEPSACTTTLPRESPTEPLFFDDCALDTDCSASAHGFCAYGQCKYGCVSDDECGQGELCFCAADVGKCVAAGCRSDADCPADYPCTGNLPFGFDAAEFVCQTPFDECESDYDCPGARMHCQSDGQHRSCVHDQVG